MAKDRMSGGTLEWNDTSFMEFVSGKTEEAVEKATIYTQGVAKKMIGGRGAGRIYRRNIKKRHKSIRRTKSGSLDRRFKQKISSTTHQASLPGRPPARDSGILTASVSYSVKRSGLKVTGKVGPDVDFIKSKKPRTDPDYGYYLEKGTLRMAARPWLKPSLIKARPKIRKIFKNTAKKI